MKAKKILYRYQLQYFVQEIEGQDYGEFDVRIELREIKVIKETTYTYVVEQLYGKKTKRIYKGARNTYAHETKEAALKCFFHRTSKHAGIMANKARIIKNLLSKIAKNQKDLLI